MDTEVVRKLTIQGRSDGMDKVSGDLDRVSASQRDVAESSLQMRVAIQSMAGDLLSMKDQVDQLAAANDNYASSFSQTYAAIQEQKAGFLSATESALSFVAHLKLVAAAAYALSPAVRDAVNPAVGALVGQMRALAPAAAAVGELIVARLGPALSVFTKIAIPVGAAVVAVEAVIATFELGSRKIEEFNRILEQATAAGVSADFFQRIAKGAEELKVNVDSATAALNKFNEASTPQLGGSAIEKRVDELLQFGNFANNSGVAALKNATTTEERYRAVIDLITKAIDQGERLAALDLAAKFLPPDLLDKLRASGDFLQRMQQTADAVKPVDLVSDEQIARAADLKKRYDDAVAILSQQFIPFQQILIDLSLQLQGIWVSIVELIAKAVSAVGSLIDSVSSLSGTLSAALGGLGRTLLGAGLGGGLGAFLGASGGGGSAGQANEMADAYSRLAAGLRTTGAVQNTMRQTTEVYTRVLGDNSRATRENATAQSTVRDFWDRATASIERNILQVQAETIAVGANVGAQAQLRAEFQLLEAAKLSDKGVTEEQIEAYVRLKQSMSAAAALQGSGIKLGAADQQFFLTKPAELGRLTQTLNDQKKLFDALKSAATDFAATLVEGMAKGESMAQTLSSALSSLSSQLIRMGTQNLFGNLFQGAGGGQQAGGLLGGGLTSMLGMAGSLAGPIGGALAVGAGALISMFSADDQKKQQQQQQIQAQLQAQQQAQEEAARRAQEQADAAANYRLQAASLGVDTSTYAGAMAKLEIDFQRQRAEAAKIGGDAIIAEQELENAQRLQLEKEWAEKIAQLKESYADREFAALNDTTTLAGKLAEYDRKAAQERADSIKTYGQAYVELEQAQAAERFAILRDAGKEISDYYDGLRKTISDFTTGLQFGNLSTLSPAEQYLTARNQFQRQLELAQGGDRTAQGGITQVAQTLLEQARNYLGPSSEFGDLVNQITQQLNALPDIAMAADPQVQELQRLGGDYFGPMTDYLAQIAVNTGSVPSIAAGAPTLPTYANDNGAVVSSVQSLQDEIKALTEELHGLRSDNAALQTQIARLLADGNEETSRGGNLLNDLRRELRLGLEAIKIRAA